jgi:hypothetical protein
MPFDLTRFVALLRVRVSHRRAPYRPHLCMSPLPPVCVSRPSILIVRYCFPLHFSLWTFYVPLFGACVRVCVSIEAFSPPRLVPDGMSCPLGDVEALVLFGFVFVWLWVICFTWDDDDLSHSGQSGLVRGE